MRKKYGKLMNVANELKFSKQECIKKLNFCQVSAFQLKRHELSNTKVCREHFENFSIFPLILNTDLKEFNLQLN